MHEIAVQHDNVSEPSPPTPHWDEMERAGPEAAAVYEKLAALARTWDTDQYLHLQGRAHKLMRDMGVTHPLVSSRVQEDHVLPYDLLPRVIGREEWAHLSAGIAQRVRIWNAFLSDIYQQQEVLKAGVIPFELVFDDPAYLRAAVGLPFGPDPLVRAASFDLARDASGQWVVIQDHVSDFSGPSYAIQSRAILSSVCPGFFKVATPKPPLDYATELLDRIQGRTASQAAEPRVVMLAPSLDHPSSYEHTLMARLMGIPLVRGGDLTVLNSRVFLRTIGGLEPIDVIYRRVREELIDPLAFRMESFNGVPGLLNCVRKGTVSVVNSLGTSLGDNLAIGSMAGMLARFYLSEPLILPTLERVWCRDLDQLETVLGRLEHYRIRHLYDRGPAGQFTPAHMTQEEVEALRIRLQATSGMFVAEPLLPLTLLPVLGPAGLEKRHAGLRLFAWGGGTSADMPACALTRYALSLNSRVISSGRGGGIKDTWILGDESDSREEAAIHVYSPQRRLRLGSRIADSLYWMGRYECRAENTARILKVMLQLQTEDRIQRHPRQWAALWEALALATGHSLNFFKRSPRFKRQSVEDYLLLDTKNGSSIVNVIGQLRTNAQTIRDSVPPELWIVINSLYQSLEAARRESQSPAEAGADTERLDAVLNQLNALAGAAAKNMLRDDGWHFWNMGVQIERAVNTVLVTRQVLMKRADGDGQSPRRDESNLDALLRMLACQYAYRSLFQARPTFQNVAALVLQDRQLPRSVLFCLAGVKDDLEAVFGNRFNPLDRPETMPPLRHCSQLISEIEFADLTPYFSETSSGRPGRLRQWLDELGDQLSELGNNISDHYLHHQNFRMLT